ncbi:hypothetical protein T440DRAFT_192563 [Plenodomus tracheiphilus IPT5]|uniref:Uncharacterized protein n=1 Tax=Plenodomus tracheiphilus IPT5 TaxID=1408161 RepID=A0A6A7AZG9_9PLEO|nr:hypothetical protein T440DRAFT_192563 [Plenodomus tracheiphilus IPT5]
MTPIMDVLAKYGFRETLRLLVSSDTSMKEQPTRPKLRFVYARQRRKSGRKGDIRVYRVLHETEDAHRRRRTYVNIEQESGHNGNDLCEGFVGIRQPLDRRQGMSTRSKRQTQAQNRTDPDATTLPSQRTGTDATRHRTYDRLRRNRRMCSNIISTSDPQQQKVKPSLERTDKRRQKKTRKAVSMKDDRSDVQSIPNGESPGSSSVPTDLDKTRKVLDKRSIRFVDQVTSEVEELSPLLDPPASPFQQPKLTTQQSAALIFGRVTDLAHPHTSVPMQHNGTYARSDLSGGRSTAAEDDAGLAATSGAEPVVGSQVSALQSPSDLTFGENDEHEGSPPTMSKLTFSSPGGELPVSSEILRRVTRLDLSGSPCSSAFGSSRRPNSPPAAVSVSKMSRDLLSSTRPSRPIGNVGLETPPYTPSKT